MRSQRTSLSTILAMAAMAMPVVPSKHQAIRHLSPSLGKSKGTGALKAARSPSEATRLKTAAQAKREQRWSRNLANARPDMIIKSKV